MSCLASVYVLHKRTFPVPSPIASLILLAAHVQDVEAYLTGASDSSDYIQLVAPELNFAAIPAQQVHSPALPIILICSNTSLSCRGLSRGAELTIKSPDLE